MRRLQERDLKERRYKKMLNATYSPEDNKLRLYSSDRLDSEIYDRVRATGFIWAPKQLLFVAPMWTPEREDLLIDLCGEIEDEDKSLVERAEERAERFEDLSDKRAEDSERASEHVKSITDGIPFGQPILVGHHSEKHARKDAQRIENGMRHAVKMWEESKYWADRAKGAIRAAKHKERPDVRARRIKGLEADLRKQEKETANAELLLKLWRSIQDDSMIKQKDGTPGTVKGRSLFVATRDHVSKCFTLASYPRELPNSQYEGMKSLWSALDDGTITGEQAQDIAIKAHEKGNAHRSRWINHITNRLTYERALQQESGGTVTDRKGPEKGGACKCWASHGGWSYIQKVNKVSISLLDNWGNGGGNFTRTIPFDKLFGIMTAAEVQAARADGVLIENQAKTGFFLLSERPDAGKIASETHEEKNERTHVEHLLTMDKEKQNKDIDAIKETLQAGIKTISAPQLFPTPPEIAEKMVELAEIEPNHRILEPSAGTGNILKAIGNGPDKVAIEINHELVGILMHCGVSGLKIIEDDFLQQNGELGSFDRIIMNPPFKNGVDIKHIRHAQTFLNPGGRLVALCANGSRQREAFKNIADYWEDLPDGSFKNQGTNVNVAIFMIKN